MFNPSLGDAFAVIACSALWFHVGRMSGYRAGYLKGRKAVQSYYDNLRKVRV